MTISHRVQQELFQHTRVSDMHQDTSKETSSPALSSSRSIHRNAVASDEPLYKTWTAAEHARFLEGLKKYPTGPWRKVAEHVGNKTARQTMNHAHKYREKLARRRRRRNAPTRKKTRLASTVTYSSTEDCAESYQSKQLDWCASCVHESRNSMSSECPDLASDHTKRSDEDEHEREDLSELDVDLLMELFGHPCSPSELGASPFEPLRYTPLMASPLVATSLTAWYSEIERNESW